MKDRPIAEVLYTSGAYTTVAWNRATIRGMSWVAPGQQAKQNMSIDRAHVRKLIATAQSWVAGAQQISLIVDRAMEHVRMAVDDWRTDSVLRELASVPLSSIKDVSGGGLRLGQLSQYGYRTVADVVAVSEQQLTAVPGVGPHTAQGVKAAAMRMWQQAATATAVRLDPDKPTPAATAVLNTVLTLDAVMTLTSPLGETPKRVVAEVPTAIAQGKSAASWWRWTFAGSAKKVTAATALTWLGQCAQSREITSLPTVAVAAQQAAATSPDQPWVDFAQRAAHIYAIIEWVTGVRSTTADTGGFLSDDLIARIEAQPLDTSFLSASLRKYQVFGAQFALAQQRVIIGDEMGLGKTVQALATLAHLHAQSQRHFLVICPASVVVNWSREVIAHTRLQPCVVHGPDAWLQLRNWQESGGVALTTFDTLKSLPTDGVSPDAVVVDEAHYIKNPDTGRARAALKWLSRTPRVLLLTGTPMENRVDEFVSLVRYVDPSTARKLDRAALLAGPASFRRAVGPVYLRRNQEQVLTELPDLIEIEEWESFGAADGAAYRQAVRSGNFMAMRRAAFAAGADSTKLSRLLEIVAEALANGRKVVVFSFFRNVLETVARELPVLSAGPLSGSTPPTERQDLVDQFAAPDGPSVLLAQIQAGGTGLNIQAASVVILCEPQIKPTLETQAIARSRRMGQTRTVQVHRLLVTDSVDQRMLELLARKSAEFDDYARVSHTAAAAAAATDASVVAGSADSESTRESSLAAQIIALEQERLQAS